MKTRKRKADVAIGGAGESQGVPELSPDAPGAIEEKPDRISFYVSSDGAPEWDRISPQTKEKLTSILQNPKVQKELGFTKEQAKQLSESDIGEDEANAILDLLSAVDAFAASRMYKIPMEITSQAFSFTPDHRKKINPPLVKVLRKWAPAAIRNWKDEVGLAIVLSATLNAQVRMMHALENNRKKIGAPAPAPKSNVTPINEPPAPKPEEKPVAKSDDLLENVGFHA